MGFRNGNERPRTVWTPEMDLYFVDLMLEQVGVDSSRFVDHLFRKQPWDWDQMSSMFNAKFNFHYEKDVLRNRHKTLRNLFRDVKNILAQPGFSWDDKRNMVTADNPVWDDYIKANPGARSWRIKRILYFKDLCTIYGHAVIEEKGDNELQGPFISGENGIVTPYLARGVGENADDVFNDKMIDDNCEISTLENTSSDYEHRTTKDTTPSFCTRTRTYWQPSTDRYFISLMLAHVHEGNQVGGVFSKQAWMKMISSFNENFGFDYSLEILKNRHKTLRRQYNVIKSLLDLDGFVWDEARHMVIADDRVWQDIIKVHADARQFMTRSLPYYKDLCIIFDPFFAEKDFSLPQDLEHQDVVDAMTESLGTSITGQSPIPSNSNEDQFSGAEELAHTAGQKQKRRLDGCSGPTCQKRTRDDEHGMAIALHEMATAVSALLTQKNDDNSISIESVIKAVQALPDMDEDLVLDACDFLEDERKAKTFLALDATLRKKWLIRKLRT